MLILAAASTDFEMRSFLEADGNAGRTIHLVTGIGPVETAIALTAALHRCSAIKAVVNFGIAGAYPGGGAEVLDLCLAEREIYGDLGIALAERIERFAETGLAAKDSFVLDANLLRAAGYALTQAGVLCKQGVFVTVSCASGTQTRAEQFCRQFHALCENMEGAAAARVCEAFDRPCLELRCVSNIVGERDKRNWRLHEACAHAGQAAAAVVAALRRQAEGISRF
jgi:futalosine hydrolase